MDEWPEVRLSDVCDLIPGFAFKAKDFGDFPDKVIKIADISPPDIEFKNLKGVDTKPYEASRLKKFALRQNDYALAMTGATIGKLGKLTTGGEALINQRVLGFKAKPGIADHDFIYYSLLSDQFQPFIRNHIDSETAQPNISATSVGKYTFPLPPLPTQQEIARTLHNLDEKIVLSKQINHHLAA